MQPAHTAGTSLSKRYSGDAALKHKPYTTDTACGLARGYWCFGNSAASDSQRFCLSVYLFYRQIYNMSLPCLSINARTYLKRFYDLGADVKNCFWYNLHRIHQISVVSCFRMGSLALVGLMVTLEDISLGHMHAYLVIKDCVHCAVPWYVRMSCICLSVQYMMSSEMNIVLHLFNMLQYMMMPKCVMKNSENVPRFWKKFSIFLLKSIELRVI